MASQNSLSSASRTRKWVCFRERAIGVDPSEKHRLSAGHPCLWRQSYLLPSQGQRVLVGLTPSSATTAVFPGWGGTALTAPRPHPQAS